MKTRVYLVILEVEDYSATPSASAIQGALEVGIEDAPDDLCLDSIRDVSVIDLGRSS